MSAPNASTTIVTLGIQGPPGAAAISTTLTAAFTAPAVSATAIAYVATTSGAAVSSYVTVAAAGTFLVTALAAGQLTLQNTGNGSSGTIVGIGSAVLVSGPPGASGATGPAGPPLPSLGTRFTLEQFDGNAGSSSAYNCSTALASALAAAGAAATSQQPATVELGFARTYYVPSGGNVPANVCVVGHVSGSVLLTTANAPVLTVAGNATLFQDFRIIGSQSGTPSAPANSQHGIQQNNAWNDVKIRNVTFQQLTGAGVYHAASYLTFDCVQLDDCRFDRCAEGVWCDVRGEYLTGNNCVFTFCYRAIHLIGGNCNFNGGRATNGYDGVFLEPGANDSHGCITGMVINHNTNRSVGATYIANGFTFANCQMYYGYVSLVGCAGLRFVDCTIEAPYIMIDYYTQPATGLFKNCLFPITVPSVVNSIFVANQVPASCFVDFVDSRYGLTNVVANNSTGSGSGLSIKGIRSTTTTGSTITYTSSQLNSAVYAALPTQVATQAVVGVSLIAPYSGGVWTCGGWGQGKTRVKAYFPITKGSGDSFSNLRMTLQLNGVDVQAVDITTTSTTTGVAHCDLEIETKAGDTINFYMISTSLFGASVTLSAASTVIVEGL